MIGYGGYSKVVLASDIGTGAQVACKILSTPVGSTTDTTEDAVAAWMRRRESIMGEVDMLKQFNSPHIIGVYDVLRFESKIYIIQELATGGDLMSYLLQHGILNEAEFLCFAYQLAHAIRCLHDHDIVHRDIKPENILLSRTQAGYRLMLGDFGQARVVPMHSGSAKDGGLVRMQSYAGTTGWQAPYVC